MRLFTSGFAWLWGTFCVCSGHGYDVFDMAGRNVEWEGDDVWFAHCCMLDDSEAKQFADKGIGIAHCPSSNLRLASGAHSKSILDSNVGRCMFCMPWKFTCIKGWPCRPCHKVLPWFPSGLHFLPFCKRTYSLVGCCMRLVDVALTCMGSAG